MPDRSADRDRPDAAALARGALAGLAAGLVAAAAMNRFQALAQKVIGDQKGDGDPATVKAAQAVATAATGEPIPDERKDAAGNLVHYALGAALGVAYGLAAEVSPKATAGWGTGLALSSFALLDEAVVPAAGLAPPPTETPLASHAYAGASHLVFGWTAEAVRRLVRGGLQGPPLRRAGAR